MTYLLRSVASSSRRLPSLFTSPIRYNSTTSTPPTPIAQSPSNPDEPALAALKNPFQPRKHSRFADLSKVDVPEPEQFLPDNDAWWSDLINERGGHPGNQFSGRQEMKGNYTTGGQKFYDFNNAFKKLGRRLRESNVRRELQLGEYYEKPGDKKRRLVSERHRRRFQEMVRRKVQLVQTIRNRA